MRLLAHLLVRIAVVVFVCLVVMTGWILWTADRGIATATRTTADRAVHHLQVVYWHELMWRQSFDRSLLLPKPDWQTLATARVIAPGMCVSFTRQREGTERLCSEAEGVYPEAPAWFAGLYHRVFGGFPVVTRPLDIRQEHTGEVTVTADPSTSLSLAWMQIKLMLQVAALMAGSIGLLVSALVVQALMPVRGIIDGLRRLEAGDYARPIARRGIAEFGRISDAVDHLAGRLAQTQAARDALTRQLFQVQEEERRALARDLHDEFGQCLAATSALAASIEAGAADRPDLVAESRAIGDTTRRMMRTLKDALVRLRSQDIDDLGLAACLRQLAARWNDKAGARVELEMTGDLQGVPRPLAIGLFRIAQECLTNAAKHGDARRIRLAVDAAMPACVAISVEDDGGGDLARIGRAGGHGLLGIRERIAALGGSLAIERATAGLRVAATLPFDAGLTHA